MKKLLEPRLSAFILSFIFVLIGFCLQVHGEGIYTVVAPRVVRPNSNFHVSITTQDVKEPTTFSVEVSGHEDSGQNRSFIKSIVVESEETKTVTLEIDDIGPGAYNLSVNAVGGMEFRNTTGLQFAQKSFSVFIVTDKGIYKPGQTVHMRVLLLDRFLKPSLNHSVDIHILDGKQNRVKQWKQVPVRVGVFTTNFTLSESPVLGTWAITASVQNQTFTKNFQVAEYVLPTFEVTAEAEDYATVRKGKVFVNVGAKYTFGKPVRGEVTITAKQAYQWTPTPNKVVKKSAPINGKARVDIDIKDLKLEGENDHYLELFVSVEEDFTQRSQNTTTQATVRYNDYNIRFEESKTAFKPGENYTATILVTNLDGSPVQDEITPVTVYYGYTWDTQNFFLSVKGTLKNGSAEVELASPPNATMIGLRVEYKDVKQFVGSIYPPPLTIPERGFPLPEIRKVPISLSTTSTIPKVNGEVEIEVNTTDPVTHLNYVVIARGDIAAAKSLQLPKPGTNSTRIRIPVTPVMAPSVNILVHTTDANGVVLAETVGLHIEGLLQNYVNLSITPPRAEPGREVEVLVKTKPNSFVGLLGVDQSVLLKQTGNDLTMMEIEDEVRGYDSQYYYYGGHYRYRRFRPFPFYSPHSDTLTAIQRSGAVFMSNGNINYTQPTYYLMHARPGVITGVGFGGSVAQPDAVYSSAMPGLPGPPPPPMPPGAGGGMRKGGVVNPPRIRKDFPETWIWDSVETGSDGLASLKRAVPDTITSWVVTGFSLDPEHGLGLSSSPVNVTVFRTVFVSLELPYSVIRGEVLAIPVQVFNYMDNEMNAEVVMDRSDDFDFAEDMNEVDKPERQQRRKRLAVPSQSSGSATFLITPKTLGHIPIKVSTLSEDGSDAIERRLLVKAEGDTQYKNRAFLVDLRNSSEFNTVVKLDIPKDIVNGSEKIEVSAIGDILGPSTENLHNLIKMPYGCGEQNMLNFVPNIVVLDYFKNTGKVRERVERDARKYMEAGYQRELSYRHEDGSFSAFGSSDPSGSTWLTAFVAKSFLQAKTHINIEDRIVDEALKWLAAHQTSNGSFPEVGKVSHTAMQGGAAHGLALTAYVLTTFLHNQTLTSKYQDTVNKGLEYILKNFEGLNDPYAIAITTFTLHLAKHPAKEGAFKLLESKANLKGDSKWWNKTITKDEEKNPWYNEPNSLDVEMTSYALLTYLQRNLVSEALPLMNWLTSQRNANGGFASTQDTVIGLQALASLASRIPASQGESTVSFSYPPNGGQNASIRISKDETMVLHKREIPRDVREMGISAVGNGITLVQVSFSYNVDSRGDYPLFTLKPQVDKVSNAERLKLSVCSGFIPGSYGSESNMAVMEIGLPSGFSADRETLPNLVGDEGVSRVETKDADTVVVLYFDKITEKELCPSISAYRTHKVALLKPVPVTVYDYYDQSRRAREFYQPQSNSLCDICDDEDCMKKCSPSGTQSTSTK